MNKRIRLTEHDLHRIVKNTIRKIINEASDDKNQNYYLKISEDLLAVRKKISDAYRAINALADKYGHEDIEFYNIFNGLDKAIQGINKNIDSCNADADTYVKLYGDQYKNHRISDDYDDYELSR